MAEESRKKTRLLIPVNESKYAFEWTLEKIIGTNTDGFDIIIIHVEEGSDGPVRGDSTSDENVEGPDGPVLALGAWNSDESHSDGGSAEVDYRDDEIELRYHRDTGWDDGSLNYFEGRCSDMKITYNSWIVKGSPEVVIPNEVKYVKPDLLVLGSRNVSPDMRDIDHPSVSDCAKHVECPVLIVKHSAEKTQDMRDPADD